MVQFGFTLEHEHIVSQSNHYLSLCLHVKGEGGRTPSVWKDSVTRFLLLVFLWIIFLMGYSGAGGKLIHEKTWIRKSRITVHCIKYEISKWLTKIGWWKMSWLSIYLFHDVCTSFDIYNALLKLCTHFHTFPCILFPCLNNIDLPFSLKVYGVFFNIWCSTCPVLFSSV